MSILMSKFREVVLSVLPITFIVVILNFTIVPLAPDLLFRFLLGNILIIFGFNNTYGLMKED